MTKIKKMLRDMYNNANRKRLKNTNISLIASNCNGCLILHDLGLKFNSPFVNLWMKPTDYVRFLSNIHHYLSCDLFFVDEPDISYPVGVLDDVRIYFQHYKTSQDAKEKWLERSKRIDFENLFILFNDRDGCTYQNLVDFDALPYKNKVVFTHIPYPEFESAYYLKGFEKEESVGMCSNFKHKFSIKKYYDDFDYVKWFNSGTL
ncbi:MAG: DUF1919 domain-containing protein [Lachnospiraceae bacterium]|nr:DUF1919 domain-containing protein [Lachnospiraceae bacterium]